MPPDRPRHRWEGADLVLSVKVLPGAKKNQILPSPNDYFRIRITAPPVDGKANKALTVFLSREFSVSKSRIVIEKGHLSRLKRIRVIQPKMVPSFIG